MSSIVVAAKPCVPNRRRAAVRIASDVAARRSACFAMGLLLIEMGEDSQLTFRPPVGIYRLTVGFTREVRHAEP